MGGPDECMAEVEHSSRKWITRGRLPTGCTVCNVYVHNEFTQWRFLPKCQTVVMRVQYTQCLFLQA
jgi:hypothetical protein